MTDQDYDSYEQDKAYGEEQAYLANLSAIGEAESRAKDEEARKDCGMPDRIAWPVDMRGWEQVGNYADCEIWAKGNQRRLIKVGGEIVWSYQVPTTDEQERKIWGVKEEKC